MGPLSYRGCVGLPHLYNALPECQSSRSHCCKLAESVGTLMIFVKNQINYIRRWGMREWILYRYHEWRMNSWFIGTTTYWHRWSRDVSQCSCKILEYPIHHNPERSKILW